MLVSARWVFACAAVLAVGCGAKSGIDEGVGPTTGSPSESRLSRWLAYTVDAAGSEGGPAVLAATRLGPTVVIDGDLDAVFSGTWSPTAPTLAVSVSGPDGRGVLVSRFGETGLSELPRLWLTADDGIPAELRWAPDGRHLAYRSRVTPSGGQHLYIADADADATLGPPPALTADDVSDLAWNPLGDALAFTAVDEGGGALYIARRDDGFIPRRVELPDGVMRPDVSMSPDDSDRSIDHGWSPDGRWLAFRAREPRRPSPIGDNRIFVTSEHGSPPTLVTPSLNPFHASAHGGSWSPGGGVFTYEDIGEGRPPPEHERYVVDLVDGSPGEPVFLAADEAKVRWTPDGRLLSVEPRWRDVRAELIEIGSADRIVRSELFRRPGRCADAMALHATTQRVVMACQREGPRYDQLVGWHPGAPEPFDLAVIDRASLLQAGWSPDGSVLVWTGYPELGRAERVLYEARLPEADVLTIERDVQWLARSARDPAMWSPDGTGYLFRFRDDRLAVRLVDPGETVIVDGGDDTSARAIGWALWP